MNRRNLLKGIFSLAALFPFMPLIKKKQDEPVIFGIDEAKPGEDVTGLTIYDNQGNITDIIIFDEPLSDYDVWLAKSRHHFNCKCTLVWGENENT